MRRFAVLSVICSLALPGLALAQTAAPPPAPGPDAPPPAGGAGHWGHHHGDMLKKMHDRFNAANTTHDGHLTLAQAQAAGLRPVVDHFGEIDTAHRGYVTFNELQAWHLDDMAKHMEQRAAQLRAQD